MNKASKLLLYVQSSSLFTRVYVEFSDFAKSMGLAPSSGSWEHYTANRSNECGSFLKLSHLPRPDKSCTSRPATENNEKSNSFSSVELRNTTGMTVSTPII